MNYTDDDIDVLARTIWGEARGEGNLGLVAVGWTIRNRVFDGKAKSWWGEGYRGVCTKAWQYSSWNDNDPNSKFLKGDKPIPSNEYERCKAAAIAVVTGTSSDPTDGATHYYARSMKVAPKWTAGAYQTCIIGNHFFFKNVP